MKRPTRHHTNRFRQGSGIQKLYDQLIDLAYKSPPNTQLPGYQELCDTFGTSRTSLREALDELEKRNIVYRTRGHGIYVSPNLQLKSVRVLFESSIIEGFGISPFWGMLWGLIMREARARESEKGHSYKFELVGPSFEANNAAIVEALRDYDKGLLHGAISVGLHGDAVQPSQRPDFPLVGYAGFGIYEVWQDATQQIDEAIGVLAAQGCRSIGSWTSWNPWTGPEGRNEPPRYLRMLTKDLLTKHDLPYSPELIDAQSGWVHGLAEASNWSNRELGFVHALRAFRQPGRKPDGVLINDDLVASGALSALDRLGIRVGSDLKIATLANAGSPVLLSREIDLTLIEYDPADLVHSMFQILDQLLSGQKPEQRISYVNPKLIPSGSRLRMDDLWQTFA